MCNDNHRPKVEGWIKTPKTNNGKTKKSKGFYLISDKTDFKPKKSKKRQRMSLHNDKRFNTTRKFNYSKYIWTQHLRIHIYKRITVRPKKRDRQTYNNSVKI